MTTLTDPLWGELERDRVHVVRFSSDPRLRIKSLRQWAARNGTKAHAVSLQDLALVVVESVQPASCAHKFISVAGRRVCQWCATLDEPTPDPF